MAILWPCGLLKPRSVAFDIAPRSLAAPAAISGFGQVVSSDAGLWKVVFGAVDVRARNTVLAFRAIATLLDGRLNPVLVPFCRAWQPEVGTADQSDAVPHSDDAFFSDGTGYVSGTIDAQASSSGAIGAVSLPVVFGWAVDVEPGQHFSIGERAYRIRTVTWAAELTATITFRPPLRDFVNAGDRLEFDEPVCRMRLASDGEMDLMLERHRFGSPTVNFIEDV